MLFIFTGKDDLDHDNLTVEDFISSSPADLKQTLEECGNHYLAINNRATGEEMQDQIECLFDKFEAVVDSNNGNYFSNKIYDELRVKLNKEINEIKEANPEKERKGILKDVRHKISSVDKKQVLKIVTTAAKIVAGIVLLVVW